MVYLKASKATQAHLDLLLERLGSVVAVEGWQYRSLGHHALISTSDEATRPRLHKTRETQPYKCCANLKMTTNYR